jgi:hypothetical protein
MENTSAPGQKGRVAGSQVRYGPKGRAQRIKTGGAQWSEEAEELFFDVLAASCNVLMAAQATGFTAATVYWHRRRRPEFAARWKEALEQGYARLEMALVEAACDTLDSAEFDADRPIPKMTVEQAMNVLRAHRNAVEGDGKRGPGRYARRRTFEEVRDSIVKKIEAIERARDIPPMDRHQA